MLQIWDTPSHEIYKTIRTNLYKVEHLYKKYLDKNYTII